MNQWMQIAIVVAIVGISAWKVLAKYAPVTTTRIRSGLARSVGIKVEAPVVAAGCGSGCTSCSTCESSPTESRTIVVHHRQHAHASKT
jgi:hypothetical protein